MAFPRCTAARAVFVWLLAATSLVAGLPRFDCVCPNGDHKVCFLGLFSRGNCCCGSVCCPPPSPDRSGQTSAPGHGDSAGEGAGPGKGCCACARQAPSGPTGTDSRLDGPCCKRTPAEAEPLAEPPTKAAAEGDADSFSLPLPQSTPFAILPAPGQRPLSLQRYDLPPPPDLVVTLRHFII